MDSQKVWVYLFSLVVWATASGRAQDSFSLQGGTFFVNEGPHTTTLSATFNSVSQVYGFQAALSYDSSAITVDHANISVVAPLALAPWFASVTTESGPGNTEHVSIGVVFDSGVQDIPTGHPSGFENLLSSPQNDVALLSVPFTEVTAVPAVTTISLTDDPSLRLKNVLTDDSAQSFSASDGLVLNGASISLEVRPEGENRIVGDVNGDAAFNIADAVAGLNFLFGETQLPSCYVSVLPNLTQFGNDMLDYNGDSTFNIADPVGVLNRLFGGGLPHVLGTGCLLFTDTDGCTSHCTP